MAEESPGRSLTASVSDRVIHVSTLVGVSPDRAFAYFTDGPLLQSWLTTLAAVEPWTGGRYELFWDPADRENDSELNRGGSSDWSTR